MSELASFLKGQIAYVYAVGVLVSFLGIVQPAIDNEYLTRDRAASYLIEAVQWPARLAIRS